MSLRSADRLSPGETLSTDICIVGAGAAGISMALHLERSRFRVLLLESGDVGGDEAADALNEIELTGHPFNVNAAVRRRGLGGSTLATYGRSVLLDAIDFEHRPWISDQDWGIGPGSLAPYFEQAAEVLGLEDPELLDAARWSGHPIAELCRRHSLALRVHRWGKYIDLGRSWERSLRHSATVDVLLRGTATDLEAGPGGGQVRRLNGRSLSGNRFQVEARHFVLACGGLENPRLLLLSERGKHPPAINWEPVGRYYMNHPRAEGVAHVDIGPGVAPGRIRSWIMHRDRQHGGRLQFAFSPDESLQREERLLNHGTFFYAVSDSKARDARRQLTRFRQAWRDREAGLAKEGMKLLPHLPMLAGGVMPAARMEPYRARKLVAVDQCEQPADANSRITLGEQVDAMGLPRARLHWRIGEETTASLRRLHQLLEPLINGSGIGRFHSKLLDDEDFRPEYMDCAHPTGATRMSGDDRKGVVDRNCRVHGLGNLYVVGSSVFPVAGQANPTFAIIALSLRLAHELADQ